MACLLFCFKKNKKCQDWWTTTTKTTTKWPTFWFSVKKTFSETTNQIQRKFIGSFLVWPLTKNNSAVRLTLNSNHRMTDFLCYIHRDIWNIIFILMSMRYKKTTTYEQLAIQWILNNFTNECFPIDIRRKTHEEWIKTSTFITSCYRLCMGIPPSIGIINEQLITCDNYI